MVNTESDGARSTDLLHPRHSYQLLNMTQKIFRSRVVTP